jgi:hypothetical protein
VIVWIDGYCVRGRLHVSEYPYKSIPGTICTQTEYGSNSFSVTQYNGLFTHFNQNKRKNYLLDTSGRNRFVRKQNTDPIIFLSPSVMVCLHISTKTKEEITCWTANRTPNRIGIRMENRACRRPLRDKVLSRPHLPTYLPTLVHL